jgi:hypothetical protein
MWMEHEKSLLVLDPSKIRPTNFTRLVVTWQVEVVEQLRHGWAVRKAHEHDRYEERCDAEADHCICAAEAQQHNRTDQRDW